MLAPLAPLTRRAARVGPSPPGRGGKPAARWIRTLIYRHAAGICGEPRDQTPFNHRESDAYTRTPRFTSTSEEAVMRLTLSVLLLAATAAFALPAGAQVGIDISSADFGVRVTTTGSDAIRILDSGDDGIQIGADPDYPNYGVYIPSPGVSTYGLWPNTANASGEWALFTVDNIQAGNVSIAGLSLVARVGDAGEVDVGDIVAASGVSEADV